MGYLAYEAVTRFEDIPTPENDPLGLPESLFMLVDTMIVFDHVTHRMKIISHVHLDGNIEESYQQAVNKIENLIHKLNQPLPFGQINNNEGSRAQDIINPSNCTKEEFEERVRKIKQYITEGEAIQVVLSQRLRKAPAFRLLKSTERCALLILHLTCSSLTSKTSISSGLRLKYLSE